MVACEYLSSGQLVFRCTNDGTGYTTNGVIAPHVIHWVQIQPGLARWHRVRRWRGIPKTTTTVAIARPLPGLVQPIPGTFSK